MVRSRHGLRSVMCVSCGILTFLACSASGTSTQKTSTIANFDVHALYSALTGNDTSILARQLGDDLVWTIGATGSNLTKTQLLQIVASQPAGSAPRTVLDSVNADTIGNTIFVSARRVDHRPLGGIDFPTSWRVLDAFTKRNGRWQLVRHTQTWLVTPVQPITGIDAAALKPFVGRYEVAPGYVDDVHLDGDHLVATLTGFPPGAPLVPVSATGFSPNGTGALIAFERDAEGRVIGYVQGYPDGRVMQRRKLP